MESRWTLTQASNKLAFCNFIGTINGKLYDDNGGALTETPFTRTSGFAFLLFCNFLRLPLSLATFWTKFVAAAVAEFAVDNIYDGNS